MKLVAPHVAALFLASLLAVSPICAQQPESAFTWLDEIGRELSDARDLASHGRMREAQSALIRVYLDRFEPLEAFYGRGAKYEDGALVAAVTAGEAAFHQLLQSDQQNFANDVAALQVEVARIRRTLRQSGLPTVPVAATAVLMNGTAVPASAATTSEIRAILEEFAQATDAYRAHQYERAIALVEHAYLEGFEPIEARLPSTVVDRVERRIHLDLRPAMHRRFDAGHVAGIVGLIGNDLLAADQFLAAGGGAGFAILNSFVIVLREGLEAVLLIAALIAYLGAIGAQTKHRRQIYAGVAAGVVATAGTWFLARTLIPISGANRELLEGITALLAVVVLLYVAHWLFQRTYIHDWKEYLRNRVGGAVSRGSSLALAALAFAAVYREGFETVLFYQALAFDAGVRPVLIGFLPGLVLIGLIGAGIIRAGLKLPLKRVFAGTNAILMYLAFVFVGKGIYNLQEAGVFAPHPISWLPDQPALRQLLGFYPLIETLAAQAFLLILLATTYLWYRARTRASAPVLRTAPLPAQPASVQRVSRGNRRTPPAAPSADPPRAHAPSTQ